MNRRLFALGAASGFLAVAAGAFGAHALKQKLDPAMLIVFETAARYQMYHAFAMIAAALAGEKLSRRHCDAAGWCFAVGTLLFSGSLYALALSGIRWFGAVTPLGGVAFLAGWTMLVVAGLSRSTR